MSNIILGPDDIPWLTEVHERHTPVQHRITDDNAEAVNFLYHCACLTCELCRYEEFRRQGGSWVVGINREDMLRMARAMLASYFEEPAW